MLGVYMKKIISENNKVLFGSIDEPIIWNYKDFTLLDFFNKEIKGIRKKFAYHQFNYVGIINPDFVIGIAVVDLAHTFSVFTFYCDTKLGMQYKQFAKGLPSKNFNFERNPDNYIVDFKSKKAELLLMKSHEKGELQIHCNFNSKLIINATFDYGWENKPLRVINPQDPNRFTLTEKCSPLQAKEIDICLKGTPLALSASKTKAIYDWSGGYLRRETNWLWASMAGETTKGESFGANLAALVNESYFPEDACWIEGQRTRFHNIIFDFDTQNLFKPWRIYDEALNIDIQFIPKDEFSQKLKMMPIAKVYFRQLVGSFSGYFTDSKGKKHQIENISGLTEFHRSIW